MNNYTHGGMKFFQITASGSTLFALDQHGQIWTYSQHQVWEEGKLEPQLSQQWDKIDPPCIPNEDT